MLTGGKELKVPFIGRKVVQGRRFNGLLEIPWASKLVIRFLIKRGEPFTWETRSWLGWTGYPPSLFTLLLAAPTFLHINTMACPAGSTRSRRDNQSMRERRWLGQRGLCHYKRLLKSFPSLPGKLFSVKRGLSLLRRCRFEVTLESSIFPVCN